MNINVQTLRSVGDYLSSFWTLKETLPITVFEYTMVRTLIKFFIPSVISSHIVICTLLTLKEDAVFSIRTTPFRQGRSQRNFWGFWISGGFYWFCAYFYYRNRLVVGVVFKPRKSPANTLMLWRKHCVYAICQFRVTDDVVNAWCSYDAV